VFAVKDLGAAAGVMVTARHNPPPYNGYEVYWSNGAQIIPPQDHGIAMEIAATLEASEVPLTTYAETLASGAVKLFGDDVERRHLDAVRGLWVHAESGRRAAVRPPSRVE
jgi:phosphomannomutase